jgi:lysozyme
MRMALLGIDVSHYQLDVDWFAVAGGNVKFAFAKATEANSFVDPTFSRNWKRIQEAGLYRGAYHFGRPGRDPETQAAHFASVVGALGFRDLPPVLDIEDDGGHPAQHLIAWTRAFILKAEQLFGRKLMIYTGHFWREKMGNPQDALFAERPLWLAAYVKNPVIPSTWSKWTIWQYTEGQHNGPVAIPGVRPCDQDRFEGSEADLDALCTGATVAVPPTQPQSEVGASWPGTFFIWPRTPAVASSAVKLWQERMVTLGFAVDTDGVYGPQSKAACAAFQRNSGLSVDGIVGRRTWDACFAV